MSDFAPEGVPDGTRFDGAAGLREALVRTPDRFVGTLTEKLLTYALGRGLTHHDAPTVRQLVRAMDASGYRWSSLVQGIVESAPFRMRRLPDAGNDPVTTAARR